MPQGGAVHEVDPGAPDKVPPAVKAEEDFLDAVVSHIDEDRSDIKAARDKVAQWYDSCDGQSRKTPTTASN